MPQTDSAGRGLRAMPLVEALHVVRDLRQDQIVVSTMGTAREWPRLSQHPLDFHYVPSAMGEAPALGLGLALACPERQVIVFNGDGCMLMNLGALVTIVAARVTNFALLVFDNGVYEVTGGQTTAGRLAAVDYGRLAAAAGFPTVASFDKLHDWQNRAAELLRAPGPRFVHLRVEPEREAFHLEPPGPLAPRVEAFQQALAAR